MFGWLRKEDEVAGFWRWFERNAGRIRKGVDRTDYKVIVHELGERIVRAAPGVMHEIGKPDADTVELILSADGVRANIAGVLALMKRAPQLPGFMFTAFRPRRHDLALDVFERRVTGDDIRYVAEPDDELLHLRVFMPHDWDWSEHQRGMAGFLMLDQALGEYDVMTGLGVIDFEIGPPPPHARPLSNLAGEFDTFRAAMMH